MAVEAKLLGVEPHELGQVLDRSRTNIAPVATGRGAHRAPSRLQASVGAYAPLTIALDDDH